MKHKKSIADALGDLALRPDPVVSAFAQALIPATAYPLSFNDVAQKEIKERLFALISRQIATEEDPSVITRALVFIDEYVSDQTGHLGPFACKFAPTANALRAHLEYLLETEHYEKQMAEDAPMYTTEKNILCAAPSIPLGPLGAEVLCDRILRAVLHQKPAKVRLMVPLQPAGTTNPSDIFAALFLDLAEQGIAFELTPVSKPAAPVDQSDKVN